MKKNLCYHDILLRDDPGYQLAVEYWDESPLSEDGVKALASWKRRTRDQVIEICREVLKAKGETEIYRAVASLLEELHDAGTPGDQGTARTVYFYVRSYVLWLLDLQRSLPGFSFPTGFDAAAIARAVAAGELSTDWSGFLREFYRYSHREVTLTADDVWPWPDEHISKADVIKHWIKIKMASSTAYSRASALVRVIDGDEVISKSRALEELRKKGVIH